MNALGKISDPVTVSLANDGEVLLPAKLLEALGVAAGDELEIIYTDEGIGLRRKQSEFDRQMEIARDIMKKNRGVLRELAK